MSKKNIRFLIYCLFAAAIVAVDQWTKYLVVENIPLFSYVGAIPKLFHLTYVQNTGAAFSALEGMQWLFVLVFAALTAAVLCGADAVYFGAGSFNARRNAKNFTEEELAAAVSYCHLRGCKVHSLFGETVARRVHGINTSKIVA